MNSPENKESSNTPLLSFEAFSTWRKIGTFSTAKFPRYNNFYLMFIDLPQNEFPRSKKLVARLREEFPDLEKKVTTAVTDAYKKAGNYPEASKFLPAVESLLYEAYVVMHDWVENDEKLFV